MPVWTLRATRPSARRRATGSRRPSSTSLVAFPARSAPFRIGRPRRFERVATTEKRRLLRPTWLRADGRSGQFSQGLMWHCGSPARQSSLRSRREASLERRASRQCHIKKINDLRPRDCSDPSSRSSVKLPTPLSTHLRPPAAGGRSRLVARSEAWQGAFQRTCRTRGRGRLPQHWRQIFCPFSQRIQRVRWDSDSASPGSNPGSPASLTS